MDGPYEVTDTTVDPAVGIEANRKNWDDRAAVHAASEMYDVEGFVADPSRISTVVRDDLAILAPHLPGGSVRGLDLVHLQCHIGTDTLSLERLGARVTGVDFSPASLDVARSLAARTGSSARFVESEVTVAHRVLKAGFDVVYTSTGTISWLPDLTSWAENIVALLRPGGTFFIRDGHPAMYMLDVNIDGQLVVRYRYFATGEAEMWDTSDTYTDGDTSSMQHTRTYEWPHSLSEVLTALLDAGLNLVAFGEQRTIPWKALPTMIEDAGNWILPDDLRHRVPLTFSIVARLPDGRS